MRKLLTILACSALLLRFGGEVHTASLYAELASYEQWPLSQNIDDRRAILWCDRDNNPIIEED